MPQLAVTITISHATFTDGIKSTNPFVRRIGCLIPVAFYFLLRVGEYTKPHTVVKDGKRVRATRTKKFVAGNVGFFHNGVAITRMTPLATLLTADIETLKILNQKNGQMGQTITQHSTGSALCPIKSLAHIVHGILSEGGTNDTLLCSVGYKGSFTPVEPCHIIDAVRDT